MITLCAPSGKVSCFACCPPIRPAGYDHLKYVKSLKREFLENRRRLAENIARKKSIMGFTCWALGYIDDKFQKIGCMLHPGVNNGEDLRHITGYGAKCARELCLQARIFNRLSHEEKLFWLEPSTGLNSFFFSSPRANPVFHLLLWHEGILSRLYEYALLRGWSCTELLWHLPFLIQRNIHPRAWRMPVGRVIEYRIDSAVLELLPWNDFFTEFTKELARVIDGKGLPPFKSSFVYVHQLDMPDDFQDFLKFFLNLKTIDLETAEFLYRETERLIEKLVNDLGNHNDTASSFGGLGNTSSASYVFKT